MKKILHILFIGLLLICASSCSFGEDSASPQIAGRDGNNGLDAHNGLDIDGASQRNGNAGNDTATQNYPDNGYQICPSAVNFEYVERFFKDEIVHELRPGIDYGGRLFPFPVRLDFGLADSLGRIVVEPVFLCIHEFVTHEGELCLMLCNFADGEFTIQIAAADGSWASPVFAGFTHFEASYDFERIVLATRENGGTFKVVDRTGNIIIPQSVGLALDMYEGRGFVGGALRILVDDTEYLFDVDGYLVEEVQRNVWPLDGFGEIWTGLSRVRTENELGETREGIQDSEGNYILEPEYISLWIIYPGRYMIVRRPIEAGGRNAYGIINSRGEFILPCEFDRIEPHYGAAYHTNEVIIEQGGNRYAYCFDTEVKIFIPEGYRYIGDGWMERHGQARGQSIITRGETRHVFSLRSGVEAERISLEIYYLGRDIFLIDYRDLTNRDLSSVEIFDAAGGEVIRTFENSHSAALSYYGLDAANIQIFQGDRQMYLNEFFEPVGGRAFSKITQLEGGYYFIRDVGFGGVLRADETWLIKLTW